MLLKIINDFVGCGACSIPTIWGISSSSTC